MRPAPTTPAALAALAAAIAMAGCGTLRGSPGSQPGWLGYRVGSATVELPGEWTARGDGERITARSPDVRVRVSAERLESTFASAEECLAQAERSLARGAADLERSRRHPTRFGGRPGWMQEADRGGWHGWAWAACDGPRQHRFFIVGISPLTPEETAAQRAFERTARFDGSP